VRLSSLRERTLGAAKWATLLNGVSQAGHLVLQFLLAGILGPDTFGLAAQVIAVALILDQMSEFGFAAAVIQREDLEDRHLDTAFVMNLGLAAAVSLLGFGAVEAWSAAAGRTEFLDVLRWVLFLPVVSALGHVQRALLTRRLQYRLQTLATSAGILANIGLSVGLALAGAGVHAILAGYYANYAVQALVFWFGSGWRPRLRFDPGALWGMVSFSMYVAFAKLMRALTRGVDVLVVGAFLGDRAAGLYSLGYRLGVVAVNQIGAVVGNVLFSSFSRMQAEPARLASAYLRSIRLLAATSLLPVLAAYAIVPALPVVLGDQWLDVTPVARVLAFAVAWQGLGQLLGPLALGSRGRSDLAFLSAAVSVLLLPPFLAAGVPFGLLPTCAAVAVFNAGAALFEQWLVERVIPFTLADFVAQVWRVLVAFVAAVAAVHGVEWVVPGEGGMVLAQVAASGAAAAAAYVGALAVLDRPVIGEVAGTLAAFVRARGAGARPAGEPAEGRG